MSSGSILHFELFPDTELHVLAYENIQNGQELIDQILSGSFPGAALNPSFVWSVFHAHLAANIALFRERHAKMKTRTLNTELIFWLSDSNSIKTSLQTFGFKPSLDAALVCLFNPTEEELQTVQSAIQGDLVDVDALLGGDLSIEGEKAQRMIELFELSEEELRFQDIEQAIVSRLSFKHVERA
jgi:hypothetical protein